jgi:hypothetical protein
VLCHHQVFRLVSLLNDHKMLRSLMCSVRSLYRI